MKVQKVDYLNQIPVYKIAEAKGISLYRTEDFKSTSVEKETLYLVSDNELILTMDLEAYAHEDYALKIKIPKEFKKFKNKNGTKEKSANKEKGLKITKIDSIHEKGVRKIAETSVPWG